MTAFRKPLLALAIVITVALVTSPAISGDGMEAYKRGDYKAALIVWRPYAEQGSARAQYNIAVMHEKGLGVPKDSRMALGWMTRAAESGSSIAQKRLAMMYEQGHEVRKDLETARKWYQSAAHQGDIKSQRRLAHMYAVGQGVAQDAVQAYMWFKVAAESGDRSALRSLQLLAVDMTPEVIAQGEKLTTAWLQNRRATD